MLPNNVATYNYDLEEIAGYHTRSIDGRVLAHMLCFVALCPAFKQNDLFELKIRDVIDQHGAFVDEVERDGGRVSLSNADTKDLLREHFQYLGNEGYRTDVDAPLFPRKDRSAYDDKKLQRDLRKIENYFKSQTGYSRIIKIKTISRGAIYDHYYRVLPRHFNPEDLDEKRFDENSLIETARFGRCSLDSVKEIIKSIEANKEANGEYTKRLSLELQNIPFLRVDGKRTVDENKLIENRTNFFNSVDQNQYLQRDEKESLKNNFIDLYRFQGIEFNSDDTITYTPPPVPTVVEFLRGRLYTDEMIQNTLVELLRSLDKPNEEKQRILVECLQGFGKSEDEIQPILQNLTQENSPREEDPLNEIFGIPKDLDSLERDRIREERVIIIVLKRKLLHGKIKLTSD